MCGRFTLATTAQEISRYLAVEVKLSISSRYNIAPSQPILTISQINQGKRFVTFRRWGLIPSWVKNLASWKGNLINARGETLAEKPSFRGAFKYRPCLIPVTGYYEWTKEKQPYYFQVKKNPLFALAGLWETWSNGEDELLTCTIVTTKANAQTALVHHRMPLILQPDNYDLWLGDWNERKQLLANVPEVDVESYPVGKTVNSYRKDSPDCIVPMG